MRIAKSDGKKKRIEENAVHLYKKRNKRERERGMKKPDKIPRSQKGYRRFLRHYLSQTSPRINALVREICFPPLPSSLFTLERFFLVPVQNCYDIEAYPIVKSSHLFFMVWYTCMCTSRLVSVPKREEKIIFFDCISKSLNSSCMHRKLWIYIKHWLDNGVGKSGHYRTASVASWRRI